MTSVTMYCIVSRGALSAAGGNRGKMMAQVGHAFLHSYLDAAARFPAAADAYRLSDAPRKVVRGWERSVSGGASGYGVISSRLTRTSVEPSSAVTVDTATPPTGDPSQDLPGDTFEDPPPVDPEDPPEPVSRDIAYQIVSYSSALQVQADYAQPRRERIRMSVQSAVQQLFTPAASGREKIQLSANGTVDAELDRRVI